MPQEKKLTFKLPAETRAKLASIEIDEKKVENMIATLKKIGIDTTSLEEKFNWAKETRKILLTEFD